jgi:hypothetical protein
LGGYLKKKKRRKKEKQGFYTPFLQSCQAPKIKKIFIDTISFTNTPIYDIICLL